MKWNKNKTYELIKGKAIAMKLTWKNDEETMLVNVYPQQERRDHQGFWEKVSTELSKHDMPRPDFVLGDFNVTEESIDRFPPKLDNEGTAKALREFCLEAGIQDQ